MVAYDIQDDRRRLKTAKVCKDFGERVQKSVFECILEETQLERMKNRISGLINPEEDGVRIYRLCAGCLKETEIIGCGILSHDEETIIV